jgi:hypothetical protein
MAFARSAISAWVGAAAGFDITAVAVAAAAAGAAACGFCAGGAETSGSVGRGFTLGTEASLQLFFRKTFLSIVILLSCQCCM